jgi:hypothetical protein
MPEIQKRPESNLNDLDHQEVSLSEQEQKENIPSSEKVIEKDVSLDDKKSEDQSQSSTQVSENQSQTSNTPITTSLKEDIDDILEEGLEDIYLNMSKEEQKKFKIKGEETTKIVLSLLGETKVRVKKIVQAIVEWLKMISGVNKFFIKQTAKIKTDKILDAKKELLEK